MWLKIPLPTNLWHSYGILYQISLIWKAKWHLFFWKNSYKNGHCVPAALVAKWSARSLVRILGGFEFKIRAILNPDLFFYENAMPTLLLACYVQLKLLTCFKFLD